MPLLEIRDLGISFAASMGPVEVVKGLSFDVPPASIFGLAGESGCGKSLTALSIMGLLPPGMTATGRITFDGRNLLELPEAELRSLRGNRISMVFQEPMTSLNPVLRVGYQIEEVITAHLRVSGGEARKIATGLLRSVSIPAPEVRMREYPHQMSGGMRQRVMTAMAIACGPRLLIADEPTTALDVTIEAQLLELLRGLSAEKDMAVVLITHDLGIIAENAESVGIMYAGRMVETSPVGALFSTPRHPYTIGLLRSLPAARGAPLRPIPGTVPRPGHLPEGCKFSDRCEFVVPDCRAEEPALRDMGGGHLARCIRAEEMRWP